MSSRLFSMSKENLEEMLFVSYSTCLKDVNHFGAGDTPMYSGGLEPADSITVFVVPSKHFFKIFS